MGAVAASLTALAGLLALIPATRSAAQKVLGVAVWIVTLGADIVSFAKKIAGFFSALAVLCTFSVASGVFGMPEQADLFNPFSMVAGCVPVSNTTMRYAVNTPTASQLFTSAKITIMQRGCAILAPHGHHAQDR